MPRVSDEHREQMRDRIRDAALACFARTGFARTSMADIIAESGLSAGAIYTYFSSKEQLLTSVAEYVLTDRLGMLHGLEMAEQPRPLADALTDMVASLPPAMLDGSVVHVWGEVRTTPALQPLADGLRERIAGGVGEYLAHWLEVERGMDSAMACARAAELTPALLGLLQGYILHRSLWANRPAGEYLDAMRALLAGI